MVMRLQVCHEFVADKLDGAGIQFIIAFDIDNARVIIVRILKHTEKSLLSRKTIANLSTSKLHVDVARK